MRKFVVFVAFFVAFSPMAYTQITSDFWDSVESSEMWKLIDVLGNYRPLPAAPAVIEVLPTGTYGQSFSVIFRSVGSLPKGTTCAFRIKSSYGGSQIILQSFTLGESYQAWHQMWDGPFPWSWSGWAVFEVVIIPPTGSISKVKADVPVFCPSATTGPLQNAEISNDGKLLKLEGYFSDQIYVSVNDVDLKKIGGSQGEVYFDLSSISEGKKNLTVCSGGECSTRIIYIPYRGSRTKG